MNMKSKSNEECQRLVGNNFLVASKMYFLIINLSTLDFGSQNTVCVQLLVHGFLRWNSSIYIHLFVYIYIYNFISVLVIQHMFTSKARLGFKKRLMFLLGIYSSTAGLPCCF